MPIAPNQTLQNLNDSIQILLTNNPIGQDGLGTFNVAPGPSGYVLAQLIFEYCLSPVNFAANLWNSIPLVYQQNPTYAQLINSQTVGLSQPAGGLSYGYVVYGITGYYAVRMRLANQPTAGSLVVNGNTIPAVTQNNPADLAALSAIASANNAQVLGLSLLVDQDLLYWATNGQQSL